MPKKVDPILFEYKQRVQKVPVNVQKLKQVTKVVGRKSGRRSSTAVEEELEPHVVAETRLITLPDLNTKVDGQNVKLLFRNVDADGFDVNIIPLDKAVRGKDGKIVPIVYAARFDMKNKQIIINGKHAFDLEPIKKQNVRVEEPELPQVYTSIKTKVVPGLVLPASLLSLRFLYGCLCQILITAATYFPVAATSYGIGWAITAVSKNLWVQNKVITYATYYTPEILNLLKPVIYVVTKAAKVSAGIAMYGI